MKFINSFGLAIMMFGIVLMGSDYVLYKLTKIDNNIWSDFIIIALGFMLFHFSRE